MKHLYDTVIFDLDGTLLDTEKYYFAKWKEAMTHFGYHMTDEESKRYALENIEHDKELREEAEARA